jgi:hypothetical protein
MESEYKPPKEAEHSPGNGHGKSRIDWGEEGERPENPAAAVARGIPLFLAEIKSYAGYYLSAKVDGYKATAKKIVGYAVLGAVAAIIGAGVLLSAAFMLIAGLANALGALLGHHMWAGQLIVGAVILGGAFATVWFMLKRFTESSRKQTERKYEGKRIQQRVDFGRDVHERAAADAAH